MGKQSFSKFLESKKLLVSDGATGTNLIQRGLPHGVSAEDWVLNNPEAIQALHKDFLDAGSNIILTCTFGGSRIRLKSNGLEENFEEVNQQAVALAKSAAEEYGALVAGSIGPLGEMLKPLGTLEESDAEMYYKEQADILAKSGADMLLVETQFDLAEAHTAVRGAKTVTDIPLIVSFSFDRGTRTMMGVSPTKFAESMEGIELAGLGINCGKSLEDNLNALKELAQCTDLPIWFKPNAGLPKLDETGLPTYDVASDQMAALVPNWVAAGARIIGGCCGTSPAHLKALAAQVEKHR